MKKMVLISLLAASAALVACEKKDEGGGAGEKSGDKSGDTKASAGSSGVKECDDYFAAIEKCPGAAKAGMEAGKKAIQDSLAAAKDDATKQAVATSCKAGIDAVKAACP